MSLPAHSNADDAAFGLTRDLSAFVADTPASEISDAAKSAARRSLLHIATGMAAGYATGFGHRQLAEMMVRTGGAAEATIIGSGRKVPAANAAMVNGATARALNLDDHFDEAIVHPGGSVIPAALAAGERTGRLSGADLIAAIAIGNEVVCRLARATMFQEGVAKQRTSWLHASVFGTFGAAAAAARLLGFDRSRTQDALGIALFAAGGTLEAFTPGAQSGMMRGMVTGFTAQGATTAALMAQAGIIGVPEPLEGSRGFFQSFFGGDYDPGRIVGDLGRSWISAALAVKPYPTCRWTHSYIHCVLVAAEREALSAADIKEIRLHVSGYVETRCHPIERQRAPENFNHAGHALPFLTALAISRGEITIANLTEGVADADVKRLAQRVKPVHDEKYGHDDAVGPAYVEIDCFDGRRIIQELWHAPGSLDNPLSERQRTDCARQNLALAGIADPARQQALIAGFETIEHDDDVGSLLAGISP